MTKTQKVAVIATHIKNLAALATVAIKDQIAIDDFAFFIRRMRFVVKEHAHCDTCPIVSSCPMLAVTKMPMPDSREMVMAATRVFINKGYDKNFEQGIRRRFQQALEQ